MTVQVKDLSACTSKYGSGMGPGSLCAGVDEGGKDSCQVSWSSQAPQGATCTRDRFSPFEGRFGDDCFVK